MSLRLGDIQSMENSCVLHNTDWVLPFHMPKIKSGWISQIKQLRMISYVWVQISADLCFFHHKPNFLTVTHFPHQDSLRRSFCLQQGINSDSLLGIFVPIFTAPFVFEDLDHQSLERCIFLFPSSGVKHRQGWKMFSCSICCQNSQQQNPHPFHRALTPCFLSSVIWVSDRGKTSLQLS